jgi:hypothetical protein
MIGPVSFPLVSISQVGNQLERRFGTLRSKDIGGGGMSFVGEESLRGIVNYPNDAKARM